MAMMMYRLMPSADVSVYEDVHLCDGMNLMWCKNQTDCHDSVDTL